MIFKCILSQYDSTTLECPLGMKSVVWFKNVLHLFSPYI